MSHPNHERLLRKLRSIADVSAEHAEAILTLPMRVVHLQPHLDVVSDGDRPSRCCLVLEGFLCRYKLTRPGKRQILSFHIPGDMPDLQSLHLEVMDHSLATITSSTVAFVDHKDLRRLLQEHPGLNAVFWRDTLIDAGIFREWMTGLGQREAYGRMARLFCELSVKLQAVGLADRDGFPMPMTQSELADALGITSVHVNRTLSELRDQGVVATRPGYVAVPDWEALCQAGQFDATYLHLRRPDLEMGCEAAQ